MKLKIVPEITPEMSMENSGVKLLSYKEFNDICCHPFIATHPWSEVDITLGRGIKAGYIKQLITRCFAITLRISKEQDIDFNIISLVTEARPAIAAELRKLFMQGGDIKTFLLKEGVIFE